MTYARPPRGATFLLMLQPDGSREVIEIVASQITLSRSHDEYLGRPFGLSFPTMPPQIVVEGYVARQVHYAPDAEPDFTPTPQAEIEAPRAEVEG